MSSFGVVMSSCARSDEALQRIPKRRTLIHRRHRRGRRHHDLDLEVRRLRRSPGGTFVDSTLTTAFSRRLPVVTRLSLTVHGTLNRHRWTSKCGQINGVQRPHPQQSAGGQLSLRDHRTQRAPRPASGMPARGRARTPGASLSLFRQFTGKLYRSRLKCLLSVLSESPKVQEAKRARRRLSASGNHASVRAMASIWTLASNCTMESNWTLASNWTMDSGGAGGDWRGSSRLALPADSELAHGLGPGGRRRRQHGSFSLAGTESRVAGDGVGPWPAAAFRAGPQPGRRRLETGRRFGSLSRLAATFGCVICHDLRGRSDGLGSSDLQTASCSDAAEYCPNLGRLV